MHARQPARRSLAAHLTLATSLALSAAVTLASPPALAAGTIPGEYAPALLAKMHLIGKPTIKVVIGTAVQITGIIVNTDKLRHDAYLQATILNKRGKVVGKAEGKADDLYPNGKYTYALGGNLTAPGFASAMVKVYRVTENVPGETSD